MARKANGKSSPPERAAAPTANPPAGNGGPQTSLLEAAVSVTEAAIRDGLFARRETLTQVLPKGFDAERFIKVALGSVRRGGEYLQGCHPDSIIKAVMEAAELGLEFDTTLGQAYLVPFWNSKTKRREAQFIPGYRGLITLAMRSGEVSSFSAELVQEGDSFHMELGTHREIRHTYKLGVKRGNVIGAYAVVRFKSGECEFEVMDIEQVRGVQASSKSKDQSGNQVGPWVTHWGEMARKTPIRRLVKRLPLSTQFAPFIRAAILDEYRDQLEPEAVNGVPALQTAVPGGNFERTTETPNGGQIVPPAAPAPSQRTTETSAVPAATQPNNGPANSAASKPKTEPKKAEAKATPAFVPAKSDSLKPRVAAMQEYLFGPVEPSMKRSAQVVKYLFFAAPTAVDAVIERTDGWLDADAWKGAMFNMGQEERERRMKHYEDLLATIGRERFLQWANEQVEKRFGKLAA